MKEIDNKLRKFAYYQIEPEFRQKMLDVLSSIEDWSEFIFNAEKHALTPILHKHIVDLGFDIPLDAKRIFKSLVFRHKLATKSRYEAMSEIIHHLDALDQNIDFVALKGIALAPMLYDPPSLRPMGDMDLLIDRQFSYEIRQLMHKLDFDMDDHRSKFMKNHHHLPSADKKVNGINMSIEWHIDAIGRDYSESYDDQKSMRYETITWENISYKVFDTFFMLEQLCHNIAGVEYYIKMINIVDIYAYIDKNIEKIDKQKLIDKHHFVYNTIRCLHLYVPLPKRLEALFDVQELSIYLDGIGQSMLPVSQLFEKSRPLNNRLRLLFQPSDWWMHMFYGVSLENKMYAVKLVRHPIKLIYWLYKRLV